MAAVYHPRPVGSTAAADQQQQPPEETTTMTAQQQATTEEPQQSVEQPAMTTQQAQLEKASTDGEQFENVNASKTTDQLESGQAAGEGQQHTREETDEASSYNTYADALKSPPRQTTTPLKDTSTKSVEIHPSVSQPSQQVAGNSPLHARDARPKTAQHRSSSVSEAETRASRSKSQPRASVCTRQTSLQSAWQTAKDKTQR